MLNRLWLTTLAVYLAMIASPCAAFITSDPPRKWGDSTLGTAAEVSYSFLLGTEVIMEGGEPVQTVPLSSIMPLGYELEIERSLIIWAAHGDLDFRRQEDGLYGDAVDIGIGAHPRDDGDNYLAHAGLPPGGDAHLASNVNNGWSFVESDPGPHILTTAVHEFGHSLGLHHAGPDQQGISVMQGGGVTQDGLHETIWQDDIDAMHFLYGPNPRITWDPLFNNVVGNWNNQARWFTNTAPDTNAPVQILNGNLSVTQVEAAASLRLGGMSSALLRLSGAGELTIAGDTVVRQGGNLAMLGGSLTTGALDLSGRGTLTQRVGDVPLDVVEVTGTATVTGGTLDVSPVGGYEFRSGDLFAVLAAESTSGEFSAVNVPLDGTPLEAVLDYGVDGVDLLVVRPGDVTFDGLLTPDDWLQFSTHLFTVSSGLSSDVAYSQGDFNLDGMTDKFDFIQFKQFYELANGQGAFAAIATLSVPEPTVATVLLLGVVALPWCLARRGRRCVKCTC